MHDKKPKELKIRARAAVEQHRDDTETQLLVCGKVLRQDIGHLTRLCIVAICWRVQKCKLCPQTPKLQKSYDTSKSITTLEKVPAEATQHRSFRVSETYV